MRSEIVFVTPELAEQWLAQNVKGQRPLKPGLVSFYTKQMADGMWKLNGEPVIFADGGKLLDGQHRLHAIVNSGVGVHLYITTGVDEKTFGTINTGRVRTSGDMLSIVGVPNGRNIAAALTWLHYHLNGGLQQSLTAKGQHRPSKDGLISLFRQHPGIVESHRILQNSEVIKLMPQSMAVFCHYVFNQIDPVAAATLFNGLETGLGLSSTDPAYHLRERLQANRGAKAKLNKRDVLALVIKCFNATKSGTVVKNLRWRTDGPAAEAFPRIAA